jgi:hypothetical protein
VEIIIMTKLMELVSAFEKANRIEGNRIFDYRTETLIALLNAIASEVDAIKSALNQSQNVVELKPVEKFERLEGT